MIFVHSSETDADVAASKAAVDALSLSALNKCKYRKFCGVLSFLFSHSRHSYVVRKAGTTRGHAGPAMTGGSTTIQTHLQSAPLGNKVGLVLSQRQHPAVWVRGSAVCCRI